MKTSQMFPTEPTTPRLRFAWAFLRRHKKLPVRGLDERFDYDMHQLCLMELAQLVIDEAANEVYYCLRCASEAMGG